jgi:hypothetical protein
MIDESGANRLTQTAATYAASKVGKMPQAPKTEKDDVRDRAGDKTIGNSA